MEPSLKNFNSFINKSPVEDCIDELYCLLASSYFFYLKTQNFHWNVKGPLFITLHDLFKRTYYDLSSFIDTLAETIRTFNVSVPASFIQFSTVSKITECTSSPTYGEIIDSQIYDHYIMIQLLNKVIGCAKMCDDEGLIAFLSDRINVHKKFIWKLNSIC
jgi:starvation-inducible DNA-binding protein